MKRKNHTRAAAPAPELNYRTLSLRVADDGRPATLDEETRSVEVIGASEDRVRVFDWSRCEIIDEILLMSGCQIPSNRQVVMLDTHRRYDTAAVIGSFRQIRVAGTKLIGRAHYSTVPEAEGPYIKMREGHLTDYSVGYSPLKSVWIPAGATKTVKGREYVGPVSIVTRWKISELSNCPIGADAAAKARTQPAADFNDNQKNNPLTPNLEELKMNSKLRKLLEARGLSADATDVEAWRFYHDLEENVRAEITNDLAAEPEPAAADSDSGRSAADPQPLPAAEPVDVVAEIAAERARASEIRALGQRYECLDEIQEMIDDGSTIDQARAKALEIVAAKRNAEPTPGAGFAPARIVADERDKFRSAAEGALLIRGGVADDNPAPGAEDLAGYSLVETARMALRMAGQPQNGNPREMVGRALSTSDFPLILANVANKSLAQGFDTAEETWQKCFATGSVNDFKTNTAARASETDDLEEVGELQEYKHGSRSEASEEYKIATYGKIYGISRQAIINDDLGALADIPRQHGEAAARKIGDVAWAVFTANAAMGDGIALFHASHSNLGSAAAPGTGSLADAIEKMKLQKDINGKRRLNIRPQFFLAPVALEGSSEQFFASDLLQATGSTDATVATRNIYGGSYFTRIYEPRLDDASATAWYLAAAKGKTVKLFFLHGKKTPYLEVKKGWDVDGVEWKVSIDVGGKAMDWRGLFKNPGA